LRVAAAQKAGKRKAESRQGPEGWRAARAELPVDGVYEVGSLSQDERRLHGGGMLAREESGPFLRGEWPAEHGLQPVKTRPVDEVVEHDGRRSEHLDAVAAAHLAASGLHSRGVTGAAVAIGHHNVAIASLRQRGAV